VQIGSKERQFKRFVEKNQHLSWREIGKKFGMAKITAIKLSKRLKINKKRKPSKRHFYHKREEKLKEFIAGHERWTWKEIADHFGVSEPTISSAIRTLSLVKAPVVNRKHRFDEDFFSVINSERKAYWLGFLITDGCVTRDGMIGISLSAKDADVLWKMKKDLQARTARVNRYKMGKHSYVSLRLHSKKMVGDLARQGVVPRKSLISAFPTIPPHLERHFIRGCWDGDGSIGKNQTNFVNAGKGLYFGVKHRAEKIIQAKRNDYPKGKTLSFSMGKVLGKKWVNYLYANSRVYMNRKKTIYKKYWRSPKKKVGSAAEMPAP